MEFGRFRFWCWFRVRGLQVTRFQFQCIRIIENSQYLSIPLLLAMPICGLVLMAWPDAPR